MHKSRSVKEQNCDRNRIATGTELRQRKIYGPRLGWRLLGHPSNAESLVRSLILGVEGGPGTKLLCNSRCRKILCESCGCAAWSGDGSLPQPMRCKVLKAFFKCQERETQPTQ
jgi:hypothetical protein